MAERTALGPYIRGVLRACVPLDLASPRQRALAREPHRRCDVDTSEGIPEPLLELQRTSKTVELCGEEHERLRCMRRKGHDGPHECLGLSGPIRWE